MGFNISSSLRRSRAVIGVLMLSMAAGNAMSDHAALPEGVTPVEATWLWGHYVVPETITADGSPRVYVYPHKDPSRIVDPPWTEVAAKHIKANAKAPAVLFLHGCSGIIRGGVGYRILLMSEGYAIFEPDAFARPGHTCDRSSLRMRHEELIYALAQIRKLPWVDQERIILMGDSQGGRTVARWDEPGFAAHIILAASCDWNSEKTQRLPRAPDGVPVLAVIGSEDGYFAGSQCQISRNVGGSNSVVIPGAGHDILGNPELKHAVKIFLRTCCR